MIFTYYTSGNGRLRNVWAAIPEHNIIIDVVRDARKVPKDSPCISCAFPAALSRMPLMVLLMV
jgi:hypothetical protein